MGSLALMGIITTTASLCILLSAAMTLKLALGIRKRWLLPLVGLAVFAATGGVFAIGQQLRELGCSETRAAMRMGEGRTMTIQPASRSTEADCGQSAGQAEEKMLPTPTDPLTRGAFAG